LNELEELKKKMLELAAKFGYKNTTFKEFTTAMKNNQSQFFSRSQNFINILRTTILFRNALCSFSLIAVLLCNFLAKIIGAKAAPKCC